MLNLARRLYGATLVELAVVLAISAIVAALALPAMSNWLRDVELRSSARHLLTDLQSARAEALSRNAPVRLSFGDEEGRPRTQLGCVLISARCPANLRSRPVAVGGVRWAAGGPSSDLSVALLAGTGLPGTVTFDALGAAPAIAAGSEPARIDIHRPGEAGARRLVIQIAARGMIRLCDPAAATTGPERCQ